MREERGEGRQHDRDGEAGDRRQPHAAARHLGGRCRGAMAELVGDERLGRDGEGVEAEGEEEEQAGADLVGGERGVVGAGRDGGGIALVTTSIEPTRSRRWRPATSSGRISS